MSYSYQSILLPKESAELVSKLATYASVSKEGVKQLSELVAKCLIDKTLSIHGFSQFELHPKSCDKNAVDELFLLDTLNFCFWSANENGPKWEISYNGKSYTGYFGLCAAICRAKLEGTPITDPSYYSVATKEQLEHIFRSNTEVPMPLLDERVNCLHEVGQILLTKYDGTFKKCIEGSKKSAMKLLELIVTEFPCFRDEADYKGHKISLYKRAQILVGDVWACYKGQGLGEFDDIDKIVMFADYRVPQVLIHFGAMEYSNQLMERLKLGEELPSGSEEEVEIRALSIHAVELVREQLQQRANTDLKDLQFNSIMIDHFLWDYRRAHAKELEYIPFHRTKGIYY